MNPLSPFLRSAGRNVVRKLMLHTNAGSTTPVATALYASGKARGGHYFRGVKEQLSHIGYGYLEKQDG